MYQKISMLNYRVLCWYIYEYTGVWFYVFKFSNDYSTILPKFCIKFHATNNI